jgi:peptidyl-prolyl cis-trans isomerase B (cyclophilin B)
MAKVIIGIVGLIIILGGGYYFLRGSSDSPQPVLHHSDDSSTATTTATTQATTTQSSNTTNQTPTKMPTSATLHTSMGDITIAFAPDIAPNTVANFIKLAQSGFYDGTKFHRVIKGFMDQGGDPLSKDDSKMAMWGTGGPGYKFNDEIAATNDNVAGAIAMANSGPNTNGSQFFINAVDNRANLGNNYTVFGRVTAGMDVVTAINNTPTGANDRPITPVVLKSVTLQ